MSTMDKDFKVKNGIQVTGGGTFGAPVTVATPTEDNHAVTRAYLNDAIATPVGDTPPSDPTNGDFWFDTTTERLKVYFNEEWISLATRGDQIPDHIHDTTIDGDGRITEIFWDGQFPELAMQILDGGTP